MKKNRTVLFIIITLISIFSFNTKVSAATELTCVYNGNATMRKKVLIQKSNGTLEAYENKKNKKISEKDGWTQIANKKITNKISKKDKNEYIDNEGHLTKCPDGVAGGGKKIKYYSKSGNKSIRSKLTSNETITGKAVIPGTSEAASAEKEQEEAKAEITGKKCSEINFANAWLGDKSTLSCLYAYEIGGICDIVQLNLKKGAKPKLLENITKRYSGSQDTVSINNNIKNVDEVISIYGGTCPTSLNVENKSYTNKDGRFSGNINVGLSGTGENYPLKYAIGKNLSTGENIEGAKVNIDFAFEETSIKTCSDLFSGTSGDKLKAMLIDFRIIIQVLVPVLLIGLGVVDFAKAVLSESEDNMKKIQNKFIKRLIIGIAFFLIPTLLRVILGIASKIWPVISADLCGII